jgi:hypothetical protein
MKGRAFIPVTVLLGLGLAQASAFEPAFGGNCLSCHGLLQTGVIQVFGQNTIADPDESATGAPDRGPLKVFRTYRGMVKSLTAEVQALVPDDTYAVQLKRLRFPGVVSGGQLTYGADCDWPEWGESSRYYTHPEISHRWPTGPTTFSYNITVEPDAAYDYYDLVFAVAGKFNDDTSLFYGEEHFYLQLIAGLMGDLDCDGDVDFADINPFILRLSNETQYVTTYPNCPDANGDINTDGSVDFGDINPFVSLLTGG